MTEQTELIDLHSLNIISTSVCRALISVGLKTVGDVRSYVESGHDLTKLKGISKTKYENLKEKLCLGDSFNLKEPEYDYAINSSKEEMIEFLFDKYYRQLLNVRLNNLRDNYKLNHKHLLPLIGKPRLAYNSLFPGNNSSSLNLLYGFCENIFKSKYEYFSSLSEDELIVEKYGWIYPFLVYKERCFVRDFVKEYNYPPSFFILYRFFRTSTDEMSEIFSKHYGIYDGFEYSREDLVKSYNKVGERIRQIYSRKIDDFVDLKKLMTDGYINLDIYFQSIINQPFLIMEESESWADVKNKENLNNANNPESLLRLFPQICSMKFKRSESKELIFVKKEYEKNIYDWYNCVCDALLGYAGIKSFYEDTQFQININNILPENLYSLFKELLIHILSTKFGIEEFENDYFVIYQNNVDVEFEIIKILEEFGVPMSLSEIFDNFKKRIEIKSLSSKTKCDSQDKLRIIINISDIIRNCGNTSKYALSYWEDVYFGNQRDKVEDLLKNSEVPLKFDFIFNQVVIAFPNVTEKSLRSSLFDKDKNRFVRFNGDYFGLREKIYSPDYIPYVCVRKSFEDHLTDLKNFIERYERFPFDRDYCSEDERTLSRWLLRIQGGYIETDETQLLVLNEYLESIDYDIVPKYVIDYNYKNKCLDFMDFVKNNQRLPNIQNEEEQKLRDFFSESRREYKGYNDFKYLQFKNLCMNIKRLGFDTGILFE